MSVARGKTVWILGAGFSRGLGAPLFADLFKTDHRIEALLGPHCGAGSVISRYAQDKTTLWSDPEEFLDFVETTSEVKQIPRGNTDLIYRRAFAANCRFALNAECRFFLEGATGEPANLDLEKWRPYHRWAARVQGGVDSVITFNYDLVLENLERDFRLHQNGGVSIAPFEVVEPSRLEVDLPAARSPETVPVYKLHGSADWLVEDPDGAQPRFRRMEMHESLRQIREQLHSGSGETESGTRIDLLMGVPGPGKLRVSRWLNLLWQAATRDLEQAEVVRFLGYRFPPTDAYAREALIAALRNAQTRGCLRRVEIVLGPESPDIPRMKKLLEYAFGAEGTSKVEVVPLYCEDYLALFDD